MRGKAWNSIDVQLAREKPYVIDLDHLNGVATRNDAVMKTRSGQTTALESEMRMRDLGPRGLTNVVSTPK